MTRITRCPTCAAALVITHDAIGRPRTRCPHCQGIAPPSANVGVQGPRYRQTAMSSGTLAWPMPGEARAHSAPVVRRMKSAVTACRRCGAPIDQVPGPGRARLRCVDSTGCTVRVRAARQHRRAA